MSFDHNPYDILGVGPSGKIEDVKSAYRRLARRLHPDANPDNPAAAEQFQDVTKAYEILLDPSRKRAIDDKLNSASENPEGHYFSLQVTPSKRSVIPLPEAQVIYLLAEIFPDPHASAENTGRESQMNLTLVLDHSNSMNGTRIEKVKIAAHQIIDSLSEKDILSVISFNDRAEVIIPATSVTDKPALKTRIGMMNASGGTEIYQGLSAGVEQNRTYLGPRLVNHVILLTDGHTFGDQDRCIELADIAASEGIGISAMGLGNDWNDEFLDELASRTGGNSTYISSANSVIQFLNDYVRNLTNVFAERLTLSIAADPDIQIESAFKLSPHPQPLDVVGGIIPLGSLQANRPVSVLLQFQLPGELKEGFRYISRLVAYGDILINRNPTFTVVSDFASEVTNSPANEDPPSVILDALSKLTLYRLQERAREALENGDVAEATRRLENLATRLLAMGEEDLANQALSEARRVAHTNTLSEAGSKVLKYQTRFLLLGSGTKSISQ